MVFINCIFIITLASIIIAHQEIQTKTDSMLAPAYERLHFFSKMSALTNCITYNQLHEEKTLLEGGCPPHLLFCSDLNNNPFADQVYIKKIILSKNRFDLGTGYIAVDHHHKVINMAFRGSSTRWDWLHDFLITPTDYIPFSLDKYEEQVELGNIPPCDNCKLHSGFSLFLSSLQESFLETLEDTYKEYPNYNLVISGHSLGAAVAILCGIEVKLRGYDPTVVTYAQPKIFNFEMSEWVNNIFDIYKLDAKNRKTNSLDIKSGYYRVVHINDYVTDLPPLYSHCGLQIDINKIMIPHDLSDLSYSGMEISENTNAQLPSKIVDFKDSTLINISLSTDLLHLYEHRHYFIQINECDYL